MATYQSQLSEDLNVALYVFVGLSIVVILFQMVTMLGLFCCIFRVRGTQAVAFALLRLIPQKQIHAVYKRCLNMHL